MNALSKSHFVLVALTALGVATVISANLSAEEAKPDAWKAPARAAKKKNPVPADDKSIAAGKAIYAQQCLSCHGAEGKGNGPAAKDLNPRPHDISDAAVQSQTDGELFWKITEGKKPMPTYEKLLSETDRWTVINYIRTFAPPRAGNAPSTAPSGG